jgi:hypothetical protein
MLTALSNLRAEHQLYGSKVSDILADAAQKFPRMKSQFAAPVAGSRSGGAGGHVEEEDLLFQADYVHVGKYRANNFGGGSGSDYRRHFCDKCDGRKLVLRTPRVPDEQLVHYGVIASGDQEIECGITRDRAKEALGASCFEREAAGLMDNFPCLVIRGVCDYADTHKNERWQGFAAASAAAFAKELLEYMPPREIQEMAKVVEVLNDGESASFTLVTSFADADGYQFRRELSESTKK